MRRDVNVGLLKLALDYYYYYKCHGLEFYHHTVAGALYKNLDLKLLHSSMQKSADQCWV